ncbi:ABC transporter substrate-binding protein [Sphingobium bisphenolivorans]|uniref:ABC transporter substrate-binding protein n=1 Tax=Sphingobium bisphenolivorans TaxID=1335760 RepID=UPI0003A8C17B|nr:ABC transporter substrate-binding protein [Sphingobium bisphenolivorans]
MSAELSHGGLAKRRWIILAAALLLLALVAAFFAARPGGKDDLPVLRVGNQKGTTRSLLEASGVLKDLPYRIEWSEFPAAQHLLEALTANATDVGLVGDAPFLFSYAGGSPLKVISVAQLGTQGSSVAILVPKDSSIRTVADLKGRRVATGKISIGHYLLLRALEQQGLTARDIHPVYLSPADALSAFSAGSVDAWATWAPFLDAALLQGKARVLVDGSGLVTGYGYHVATPEAIERKADLLRDFSGRLARAYEWANRHERDYGEALAKVTGLPQQVALSYARRNNPRSVPFSDALVQDARQVVATIGRGQVIAVAGKDVQDAFDPRFFAR